MASPTTIVFFDGYCGLCNETVDFLISRDHQQNLQFAPLQGETAGRYLMKSETEDLDTVIVVRIESPESFIKLKKSTAVLFAVSQLSPGWELLSRIGMLVPGFIRDFAYDLVAKNRMRLMGRRSTCRLPSPEERSRILP